MLNLTKIFQLLISFCLLVFLFYWVPLGELTLLFREVSKTHLVLAFTITIGTFSLSVGKLWTALKAQGLTPSFWTVYRAYYVGSFFNNFIPTSIGGDVVKTIELNSIKNSTTRGNILAVAAERLSGILVLALLGLYFLLQKPIYFREAGLQFYTLGWEWTLLVGILSLVMVLLGGFLTNRNESGGGYSKIKEWIQIPFDYPKLILVLFFFSVLFHFLRGVNYLLLVHSFGYTLAFDVILFVLPLVAFASFLPISMGGIGLREGIITFCLHAFGLPLDVSMGVSLLLRGFSLIHSSLGGFFYARKSL